MNRFIKLAIGEFLVLAVLFCFEWLYPYEDSTLYAPAYNEAQFARLKTGATRGMILQHIGDPLNTQIRGEKTNLLSGGSLPFGETLNKGNIWLYTMPTGVRNQYGYQARSLEFSSTGRLQRKESYFVPMD